MEEFDISSENPKLYGVYDMAYSPVNGHIFARTEVCCTCGFEGADKLECGRYGSGNITVAGELVEGQCGRHCQGGVTDTIGVVEFDTNSDSVVGTHGFVGTAPVYQPFASPDGKHIIMFGLDGGRTVEILKAGASGMKSTLEHTISLDFNTSNVEEYGVYSDFVWIQTADMNCFIVASSNDYKVALINMDTLDVDYVMLKDIPYEGRARSRQVEWAEGTKYVWIGGREQDEVDVIDIEAMKVVKTFTEVDPRKLLSVANHHFMGMAEEYGAYFADNNILSSSSSGSSSSSAMAFNDSSESDDNNTLSIVALALSCVAIAAVVASMFVNKPAGKLPPQESAALTGKKVDDPSLAVPPSVA